MLFTNLEFDQEQQNRMRALSAPDEVHFGDPEQTQEADWEAFLKAEIAFGWCPPEWLAEAGALRWMQFDSVGIGEYAHLDWDRLSRRLVGSVSPSVENVCGACAMWNQHGVCLIACPSGVETRWLSR